jgi:release factor glutamine methyltransferase
LAARNGAQVTAVDINQTALEALQKNALDNSVSINIQYSDLFENLAGETFDYIIINPPYYPKTPQSIGENAWFCGEGFEYFEHLFRALPAFLANTETYMILSEDCDLAKIKAIAQKNGMAFELVQEKKVVSETNYIFQIT